MALVKAVRSRVRVASPSGKAFDQWLPDTSEAVDAKLTYFSLQR